MMLSAWPTPRQARIILLALLILSIFIPGCRFFRRAERSAPLVRTALRIYFLRAGDPGDLPAALTRIVESRTPLSSEEKVRRAMIALLAGPTKEERRRGYTTAIPEGVQLIEAAVNRPLATLDCGAALERIGGTMLVKQVLDQLAYTACSVAGIKGVVLQIEGERVGTDEHPFTGEGFLFEALHPPVDGSWASGLGPADALDLFIAVIPDREKMWRMAGPLARGHFGSPRGIETSAYAEGLGAWRGYRVEKQSIEGDQALVIIAGRQELEGQVEEEARYEARMVREDGRWRFDLGTRKDR